MSYNFAADYSAQPFLKSFGIPRSEMNICGVDGLNSSYCKYSMCVYVFVCMYMYEEISYERNEDVKFLLLTMYLLKTYYGFASVVIHP